MNGEKMSDKSWNVSFETKCQGMNLDVEDKYHAISFPIYQTATFSHPGLGESSGYDYSRQSNPTRSQLESILAGLENGSAALAFSSGMSAITTLFELFGPGDHVVIDEDLYGGSVRLFDRICKKRGINFSRADLSTEDIEGYITDETKAVYLETPTNPMMHVTDIAKLAAVTKEKGVLLIVDNTFMSPYFQNPLDLGADVVVHSGTKFICGHHDTIGGFLVVNDKVLEEKLRYLCTTLGNAMAPFDSWLMIRGIRTLAVRMERAQENALAIAKHLRECPLVTKVIYPGFSDHPGYELMKKQARGFGAMITFEVASPEIVRTILDNAQLFYFAESLGGTETLITYPITQTHAEIPPEQKEKIGITDRLLRLSVGIEGVDDLITEIDRLFSLADKK
ncbi:MAG: PLP-dependent aspartate aminotransferase family protein [Lachnospiraceae bacterium]|nr:PLP-dependent aspartate aminotransferase family protein [Lachnospiraceae bacterium]